MTKINNVTSKTHYEGAMQELQTPTVCSYTVSTSPPIVTPQKRCVSYTDGIYELVHIYPFSHRYISEVLTASRIEKMLQEYDIPKFLDAQTGCGKSTLIFDVLYPLLEKRKKKLLLIVSRSSLKTKSKYDAIDAAQTDHCERYTPLGIEKEHHFGSIDVYSYQDFFSDTFSSKNQEDIKNNLNSYGAVVFDECHFFLADADFNCFTESIFDFLITLFSQDHIPRFYLTATPDMVFDRILIKERDLFVDQLQRSPFFRRYTYSAPPLQLYYFKRNYKYIQPYFFENDEILLNKIAQSQASQWLIFVDSIKHAEDLQAKYQQLARTPDQNLSDTCIIDSAVLHTKKRSPEEELVLQKLIDAETIPENIKILFATKCLDVGINIKSKNINIACFLTNKVDFIQSIGRKRVTASETVNLYIPLYSVKQIRNYHKTVANTINEYYSDLEKYPPGQPAYIVDELPRFYYIWNGNYQINGFALKKLHFLKSDFQTLLDKLANATEKSKEYEIVAKHFLSWMELENNYNTQMLLLNPDTSIENADKQSLLEIINSYKGDWMNQQQFQAFTDALQPFDPRKDKRNSRSELSTQTVNTILSEFHLKIQRNKDIYQIISIK